MVRFVFLLLLLMVNTAYASSSFIVKDIRLEGLQRISAGTVFNYLPIKVGEKFSLSMSSEAIRSLYGTGFFKDVRLEKEGNVLVIFVAEKPAIAGLNIEGNNDIPTDKLEESLTAIGLAEGRVFDRSVLERIKLELQRQYYSLGKYALQIKTEILPLERNRVEINIKITEGDKAEVYALNIIGNTKFPMVDLLFETSLGEPAMFGGRENYSKQVLSADLEAIKSYYMDRGYINFSIASTQVSVTPDKQDVYVTVNIAEGEQFTIDDIKLAGDLVFKESEVNKLIEFKSGEIFSRAKLTKTRKNIQERLAMDGYAFANVNIAPETVDDKKLVNLLVFIEPGKRVYVRRVNIAGNVKTKDRVVRREIRQMEAGKMSTTLIANSQKRLNRTGFFEDVSVETPAVPGENDLVDINYSLKERSTGTLQAGIGYSDQSGTVFTFSVSQNNFLGTGTRMSFNLSQSETRDDYSVSYTDPYHTPDGISRSFSLFSSEIDSGQVGDIVGVQSNTYGGRVYYGLPLSETQSASAGLSYEYTELLTGSSLDENRQSFINDYGNEYALYKLNLGWQHDSRNRAIFASDGMKFGVGTEYVLPDSDIEFYKWNVDYSQYFAFTSKTSVLLRGEYGRGEPLGHTRELPFFENYYAGGSRSVRGYKSGTLGPKYQGRSLGGTSRFVGNLELILPNPFADRSASTRMSLFWDMGYAYGEDEPETTNLLRHSYGVSLIWITPVGAMRFSYAEPYDARSTDDTQHFQFTLGTPF
ncbi:MAG: outer membrane protein assembly factor BamA [Gammaproteobacteria bacterium]|nr:outer membrane protein assembly factor BamA [Gammaproteobacteria bacterium]